MKVIKLFLGVLLLSMIAVSNAYSDPPVYTMAADGWFYYKDGVVSPTAFTLPMDFSSADTTFEFNTPGLHTGIVFYDAEIDEAINTYFNEYGAVVGTPAAGQTWEIDEPGYVFGDIFANFTAGALDNSNSIRLETPDDVSMAIGWNFTLGANEKAILDFSLNDTLPTSGFYLAQIDPESAATLYFSSTLDIVPTGVPEPGTLMLLAAGLAGIAGIGRKMKS